MRSKNTDGLTALHQQGVLFAELEQTANDRAQRLVVSRRLAGSAVDDELLGPFGHVAIEVVQQHPQRRFGRPGTRVQLGAARGANPRQVAAQRLDDGVQRAGRAHASSPISDSTASRIDPWRIAVATDSISAASGLSS